MRSALAVFLPPDRNVRSTYDFIAISNESYGLKELKAWYSIDLFFIPRNLLDLQIMTCHSTVLDR
jgi:hypothetical protein